MCMLKEAAEGSEKAEKRQFFLLHSLTTTTTTNYHLEHWNPYISTPKYLSMVDGCSGNPSTPLQ